MSAADMKRAAHRVISTLLQEAEEGDTGEGERGPASTESGTRGFEGDDARVMSYAGCGAEGRGQRDGEDCAAVESELDRGGLDSVNGGACNGEGICLRLVCFWFSGSVGQYVRCVWPPTPPQSMIFLLCVSACFSCTRQPLVAVYDSLWNRCSARA